MAPAEGTLGLGRPLLGPVVPADLVRVALLMPLAGLGETELRAAEEGPDEGPLGVGWATSETTELGPWLLNALTGCLRARGDGAAGDRNLLGEDTGKPSNKKVTFNWQPSKTQLIKKKKRYKSERYTYRRESIECRGVNTFSIFR